MEHIIEELTSHVFLICSKPTELVLLGSRLWDSRRFLIPKRKKKVSMKMSQRRRLLCMKKQKVDTVLPRMRNVTDVAYTTPQVLYMHY